MSHAYPRKSLNMSSRRTSFSSILGYGMATPTSPWSKWSHTTSSSSATIDVKLPVVLQSCGVHDIAVAKEWRRRCLRFETSPLELVSDGGGVGSTDQILRGVIKSRVVRDLIRKVRLRSRDVGAGSVGPSIVKIVPRSVGVSPNHLQCQRYPPLSGSHNRRTISS